VGTSSTLFNQILLNLPSGNESTAQSILEDVLQVFSEDQEDIAVYPNPFKAINGSSSTVSTFPNLTLVDGVLSPLFCGLTFSGRRSSKCTVMAAPPARTECRLCFRSRFQRRYAELAEWNFIRGNVPEVHAQCYK
jgi:Lysophospholipase catalytic domain